MRNLFFILLLFLTSCALQEQVEVAPEKAKATETTEAAQQSASSRSQSSVSWFAEVTSYQITGQSSDYAYIEFTLESEDPFPNPVIFDFTVTSSYDFEGRFSVSNSGWRIASLAPIAGLVNSFTCVIVPGTSSIVIEDIICQLPANDCGECDGLPPSDCIGIY